MKPTAGMKVMVWWAVGLVLGCVLFAGAMTARAEVPSMPSAESLLARYVVLRDQLNDNPFQRPLVLDSRQTSGDLHGDIHALVEHPFVTVGAAVKGAPQWCDILILHLNVKHCSVAAGGQGDVLTAYIGRKTSQPLTSAHRVAFRYRVAAETADYVQIHLDANSGPFGTRDYRIVLEAVPLDDRRTFVHLSYSYAHGPAAALAMRAYFSTAGSAKVGFTVVDRKSDGRVVHVGDIRGALERNTMRYFLAIDAYLSASSAPPETQLERRLRGWFAATERYSLQLHEIEQGEYLDMKRGEYRRLLAER